MNKRNLILLIVVAGLVLVAGGSFLAKDGDRFLAYHSLLNWFSRDSGTQAPTPARTERCTLQPKPREFNREPYYTGKLIEPHLHLPTVSGIVSSVSTKMGKPTPAWDKDLSIEYLNCLSEAEGVSKIFGFHLLTKYSASGEAKIAKEMNRKYPGKLAHFLMPTFITPWVDVEVKTVREILEKNPGVFVGIGELKMFDGRDPDDPKLLALYDLAKEFKLIIMMHPFNHHLEAVERMVREYKEVTFLLHGIDLESDKDRGRREAKDNIEWVMRLLKEYPNVYYSIGNELSIYGFKREHMGKALPPEELLPKMREEFDEMLDSTLARWKRRIEAYPDKILGAQTDRWYRSHYDYEVSGLTNEFVRSFIGGLDPRVQEKVAYQNAERLLQGTGREN